jgi:hypothetical protein
VTDCRNSDAQVIGFADLLIAEKENVMFEEGRAQAVHDIFRKRFAQIQSLNCRAKCAACRNNLHMTDSHPPSEKINHEAHEENEA